MRIKVLVVEDNITLNQTIVDVLRREDFSPFGATDIEGAKESFLAKKPHIILLDIKLPGGSGYNLIHFFRQHLDSRVIMLTALNDRESKAICYKNGADDYITKPFDLDDLKNKLGAIRKRILSSMREYSLGDIVIREDSNELICKEKRVVIQPSQTKLLKLLYKRYKENSYVDKAELIEGFLTELDESNRIHTLVGRLRKNISLVKSEEVAIETIYGKGYQLDIIKPHKKTKDK